MIRAVVIIALLLTLVTACRTVVPDLEGSRAESGFLAREIEVGSTPYPYVVWIPPGFDPGRSWPVVLFLHGAGERGNDGWRQTAVGLGSAIRWHPDRFANTIVVLPQAPEEERWIGPPAEAAMLALERTIKEFSGDPARVILTGLSLGGYGTWHLAASHPDRFAALVPICGGIVALPTAKSVRQLPLTIGAEDPYEVAARAMPRVPIWIFHGAEDPVIPAEESRRMHEELQALGLDVRYTEYPGVGHNAWDPAYGEPELWEWVMRRRR